MGPYSCRPIVTIVPILVPTIMNHLEVSNDLQASLVTKCQVAQLLESRPLG